MNEISRNKKEMVEIMKNSEDMQRQNKSNLQTIIMKKLVVYQFVSLVEMKFIYLFCLVVCCFVCCLLCLLYSNEMKDLETKLKSEISRAEEKEKLLSEQLENVHNTNKEMEKRKQENEQLESDLDR